MFPVGINVFLPFPIHEIVKLVKLLMPSPPSTFHLLRFSWGKYLPSCLTLTFALCFHSAIRCQENVYCRLPNIPSELRRWIDHSNYLVFL